MVAATGCLQAAVNFHLVEKGPAEGFKRDTFDQLLQFLFINHGIIVAGQGRKCQLLLFGQQDPVFHS